MTPTQVYRHLLFNRLGREDDRFDVSPSPVTPTCISRSNERLAALHHPAWSPSPSVRRLSDVGTHRESNTLIPSPPINTASTLHLGSHQRDRTTWTIEQHRQTLKRARIPAHTPPIPLLPRPLRNRNSIFPPPHPHAAELQVSPSLLCNNTTLPSQSAHQHGVASLEFHEVVPAAVAGVELRSAEQRERRVVGGHHQQCRRAGDLTGLRVCASGAAGGCGRYL